MAQPSYRAGNGPTGGGADTTSLSFDMPTGTVEDDVMVLLLHVENDDAVTAPGGWTLKDTAEQNAASGPFKSRIYWKRAGASEAGPYAFSWTNTAWAHGFLFSAQNCVTTGDPFGEIFTQIEGGAALEVANVGINSHTDSLVCLVWESFENATKTTAALSATVEAGGHTSILSTAMTERFDNINLCVSTAETTSGGGVAFAAPTAGTADAMVNRLFCLIGTTGAAYTLPTVIQAGYTAPDGTGGAIASGTSLAIGVPLNVQANDILIACLLGKNNLTITMPTGFTSVQADNNGATLRSHLGWKRADGTEGGTTLSFTTTSTATLRMGFIVIVRNCETSGSPFDGAVATTIDTTADTNIDFPSFTPTQVDDLIMWVGYVADDSLGAPGTLSAGTPTGQPFRRFQSASGDDGSVLAWSAPHPGSTSATGARTCLITSDLATGYTFGLKKASGAAAAELEADVSGAATVAAALTTAITMAAALAGAATIVAPLTTAIRMAATPAGAATTSADLSTSIRMASALSGGATISADLSTAITFAAAVSGSSTCEAPGLETPILFEASLAGGAATQADLSTAIALAATVAGSASQTSALTTAIPLASAVAGGASTSADLSTQIRFAAALASSASTTADLTTEITLNAALSGSGALAGELQGDGAALEAALAGSGSVTAALSWAPYFMFGTGDPGATTGVDSPVQTGTVFRSEAGGRAVGVRFWKTTDSTGAHSARLWALDGTQLAVTTEFSHVDGFEGWTEAYFDTPVDLTAGTHYVVSVFHPNSGYAFTGDYFLTTRTFGPLVGPASADVSGGNGRFIYGAATDFPSNTFNENGFWVSPLVEATPLEAAVTGEASVTATMEATAAALQAAVAGAGSTSADLTTAIPLAAAVSGSASVAADLTTAIALQSAVQGGATATAALSTAIEMAGSMAGTATTSAALTTQIRFAAALDGSATIAGAFEGVAAQLAATPSGSATTTADLSTAIALAAAVAGSASIDTATLSDLRLAADLAGSATTTAGLTTAIRMAAALEASGSIVAPLTTAKPLEAAVSGSSSTSAAITTAIALAAAFEAPATVTANFTTAIRFAAALAGAGSVSALLTETARFAVIQVVNESTNRYRVQAEAAACGGVRSEARVRSGMQAEAAACGGVQDESAHHPGITAEDTP